MCGNKAYLKAMLIHKKMYGNASRFSRKKLVEFYNEYFELIKKSAYAGKAEAQYDLAQQYEDWDYFNLSNPNYNPKKCIYWYTKACEQNYPNAYNNLATFYESGVGCKKNLNKALSLYKKSAILGYSLGKQNYKIMLKQLGK